jgi:hypothetical protein
VNLFLSPRLKELAAFIHHFFRNHLALSFAVLFKPGTSPEKVSAGQVIIFTIPTVSPRYVFRILSAFILFSSMKPYGNDRRTQGKRNSNCGTWGHAFCFFVLFLIGIIQYSQPRQSRPFNSCCDQSIFKRFAKLSFPFSVKKRVKILRIAINPSSGKLRAYFSLT